MTWPQIISMFMLDSGMGRSQSPMQEEKVTCLQLLFPDHTLLPHKMLQLGCLQE